ncbi:MerR family transcriptional regulator [Nocardioides donggukensis]|uniref:MerR family transcriptional regulator n=1 Tax=Nocardioides donggukensis TaxID=2774019 RepID=A0A927K206_9ACTN|nr:MerR family transcriptional regulator [Nocardioides donggukensis]MBD8868131.1 MerR family transcriptional regulator [Nocardioides donggukensis]
MDDLSIGDVAHRTGLTQRTLRYYEELGLLSPERDGGGRRRYRSEDLDRLYRVRLLRELGTPLAEVDPDADQLLPLTRRRLVDLDARLAELARTREAVRSAEERLLRGAPSTDEEILDLLAGLPADEPAVTRRLTLLVYRDIAAAQQCLVDQFGLVAGELSRDGAGEVVHGEVFAGDGVIWMHRESADFRLASPATLGGSAHCMAIDVDDVDAHHRRAEAAGAEIVYPPTDMPYGVREYGARDSEGGLWSFMRTL